MTEKLIATNRKARHFYNIEKSFEAGLVLQGPEIKAVRQGRANIDDSYAMANKGELFLVNMHISPYAEAGRYNPTDPTRPRKLLLHKREIHRLIGSVTQKGYTIVPLRLYFNSKGFAKVEIALARGKKLFDRREDIKGRTEQREIEREHRRKAKY